MADHVIDRLISSFMRMIEIGRQTGPGGVRVLQKWVADEVLRRLFPGHDLHPFPLVERLQSALAKLRSYLKSHGGNIDLVSLNDDRVVLKLSGTCHRCPSSSTMELAIRHTIEQACPDLEEFIVEGLDSTDQTFSTGSSSNQRLNLNPFHCSLRQVRVDVSENL